MKIFSLDAETNGLYGQAFALAAVVKNEDGSIAQFLGRCPIEGEIDSWVEDHVLPEMKGIEENYSSYEKLLKAFSSFYYRHKTNADIIVHMGVPVEAKIFIDLVKTGWVDMWDGPYPLIDISAYKEIGTSVDSYNKSHGIEVPFEGSTHNPLYDSWAALVAYEHYMG